MTGAETWDAKSALAGQALVPWQGPAWRYHRRSYAPTDASGSLLVSGRYHRAADSFLASDTWPALYLALSPEIALGEVLRHFNPQLMPRLNQYRLTELNVDLEAVLDCRDAAALGLDAGALVQDYDFATTQALAAAAIAIGAEALLVASATALGDNLVLFAGRLHSSSRLTVVRSRNPRLYVRR
jgi:RES domain-containing protein